MVSSLSELIHYVSKNSLDFLSMQDVGHIEIFIHAKFSMENLLKDDI